MTMTPETTTAGRYPAAEWKPLAVNFTPGGNRPQLLIVHIMEGTLAGTDSWFRNPASQVSAHFGLGRTGGLTQWVDTNDIAWHAAEANDHSIGVECEGNSGQPLTSFQLDKIAGVFKWAHDTYPAISLWLNARPDSGSGLSWHGLGGVEWGNHPDCPGAPVVHQLGHILELTEVRYPTPGHGTFVKDAPNAVSFTS